MSPAAYVDDPRERLAAQQNRARHVEQMLKNPAMMDPDEVLETARQAMLFEELRRLRGEIQTLSQLIKGAK